MLASFTKVPELALEPVEAQNIASAVKGVADHYDIKATEKTLAWTNLATTVAMVYGTRVFAYQARKASERKDAKSKDKTNPNVVMMPGR